MQIDSMTELSFFISKVPDRTVTQQSFQDRLTQIIHFSIYIIVYVCVLLILSKKSKIYNN